MTNIQVMLDFLSVHYPDIIINACIAVGISFLVGLYIRFKVKPKHEVVFELNREAEIKQIFSSIHFFDHFFDILIGKLEKEISAIPKENKSLRPEGTQKKLEDGGTLIQFSLEETQLQKKLFKMREILEPEYNEIKKITDNFKNDYTRMINHVEISFLNHVWDYILKSQWYLDYIYLNNYNFYDHFKDREKHGKEIIASLKKDKILESPDPFIKEFFDKYKK